MPTHLSWPLFGLLSAVAGVVTLVNMSSTLIEHPAGDRDFAVWELLTWEISSVIGVLSLLPPIYFAYRRFYWGTMPLLRFFGLQLGCAVAFSLAHVGIMVAIRVAVYAFMSGHYDFAHGDLWLQLIYEGRKDILTYAVILSAFWSDERLRDLKKSAPEALPERIEVRTDGRTLYIAPAGIVYAEAAGNYVEMHLALAAKPLLLRGTLSAFESQLKPYGFVRIHRSRLLNRSHMVSHAGTPSGDIRIVLSDGRELNGSRRYRDNL